MAAKIRYLYKQENNACILACSDNMSLYEGMRVFDIGSNVKEAAHNLFAILRETDEIGIARIFAEALPENGIGLAVMNRMARAAAFDIIEV